MSAAASYHHGNLRAELLGAAERALGEVGADGLSLRALARELGVSHAAPAKHFADRRALLDALAVEGFARLSAGFRVIAAARATPVRDRLRALVASYLAFAQENPALLALMFAHKTESDVEASADVLVAGREAMALTVALVAEGQSAGEIVEGDPARIATVAFATVHGIATIGSGGLLDGEPTGDVADAALALLWEGIAARG
ncbi:MAG: TetR/AcrR family transcriptional regulator [Microbacterium sp.]|uniref:TetR/AcrR family transcriptional regulator n=1 Tax=Microbacterium sp. TaxID=51671 RepID=UPI002819BFEE|nr:TetR/AcrR family transcriptional regulator [Microbacterium sp.]MDR2322680.1 TetR/AcrR family transcriptional regulator [Microbacterium sp.]